jgi:hypothetical protein
MNKDNHNHIQFAYFINEEEPMGRYWTKCYIDEYKDRTPEWIKHKISYKTLDIK